MSNEIDSQYFNRSEFACYNLIFKEFVCLKIARIVVRSLRLIHQ